MGLNIPILENEIQIPNDTSDFYVKSYKILREFFGELPETIKEILRKVIYIDSKLIGYSINDFSGIHSILMHRNTFSRKLICKLYEKGFTQESFDVETDILINSTKRKISEMSSRDFLRENEKILLIKGIVIKAYWGFNRFYIYAGDPYIYLDDENITNTAGIIDIKGLLLSYGGVKLLSEKTKTPSF